MNADRYLTRGHVALCHGLLMPLFVALVSIGCAEEDSLSITIPVRGGQFNAWGITLTVPPGAVSEPVEVKVTRLAQTLPGVVPETAHLLAPEATTFLLPVKLTIWLAPENLSKASTLADISMVKRSAAGWQPLGGPYESKQDLFISASVTTLGSFAAWDARALSPLDSGVDGATDAGVDMQGMDAGGGDLDGTASDMGGDTGADLNAPDAPLGPDASMDLPLQADLTPDSPPGLDLAPDTAPSTDLPVDTLPASVDMTPASDVSLDIPNLPDSLAPDSSTVDQAQTPDQ